MKVLNIYANLFYEISLYFFIIIGPKDGNPYVTAFFFFTWIISGLISGLPSWYVQMGFNLPKKHVDFDAIAKLTQILIVFNASLLIKHISYETILTILSIISLVNVINRFYLQSALNKSIITLKYLDYIRKRDPLEDKILRKKSFGIGFPSLIASTLYDANSVWLTIVIFAGFLIIEIFLIHRLYKSMCVYDNFSIKSFGKL